MRGFHLLALAALACCASAVDCAQAKSPPGILVAVPFVAEPVAAQELQQRTVAENEPFMVRRLTALKSATLQADVSASTTFGAQSFAKGLRLLLAKGLGGGSSGDFYCGSYQTGGIGMAGLKAAARTQWICFEDKDGDLSFETAYLPNVNEGALLPSFYVLRNPQPVRAAYSVDPEADRDYYETAITFQKTFNIYGMTFFFAKGRRQGETIWSDLTSSGKGVQGGSVAVKPKGLPKSFELDGAKVQFIARDETTVTVKPESAPTGVVAFTMRTTY